jgi:hypothetical protein
MRLKFKNNTVRELPFNAKLAARLIVLSQKHDEVDYRLELDPALPLQEKQKQLAEVQSYVDHFRIAERCGKKF